MSYESNICSILFLTLRRKRLRFPGGTQQVVPVGTIKRAGYLDGSSVMPDGLLDSLTETQIVDLVRYVPSIP